MRILWIASHELMEILVEKGINITVTDNMVMVVSDLDAARIAEIVKEYAPAAANDYCLEDADEEFLIKSGVRQ